MARRLAGSVFVNDKDGVPVLYKAGTTPPEAVAKQITNPSAWVEDPDGVDDAVEEAAPAKPKPTGSRRSSKAAVDKAAAAKAAAEKAAADAAQKPTTSTVEQPAADADADAWRAYAIEVGVTPAEDADVDAIKAELGERGLLE